MHASPGARTVHVGIEIVPGTARIAARRSSGELVFEVEVDREPDRSSLEETAELNPEWLSAILDPLVRLHGLEGSRASVGFGADHVHTQLWEQPGAAFTDEIRFWREQFLKCEGDEAWLSMDVLEPTIADGPLLVFRMFCARALVLRLRIALERSGLHLAHIDHIHMALARSVSDLLPEDDTPTAIIEVGALETRVVVCLGRRPRQLETVRIGPMQPEPSARELARSLQRIVDYFHSRAMETVGSEARRIRRAILLGQHGWLERGTPFTWKWVLDGSSPQSAASEPLVLVRPGPGGTGQAADAGGGPLWPARALAALGDHGRGALDRDRIRFELADPSAGPEVHCVVGDVVSAGTEVLVTTANPAFQLTGGIGAAIWSRAGKDYQLEVNRAARQAFGERPAPRGAILRTTGGDLPYQSIYHVVSIDPFYRTTAAVIEACTRDVLLRVDATGATSVALPAFATGYGRFPLATCGRAMRWGIEAAIMRLEHVREIRIYLFKEHQHAAFAEGWAG